MSTTPEATTPTPLPAQNSAQLRARCDQQLQTAATPLPLNSNLQDIYNSGDQRTKFYIPLTAKDYCFLTAGRGDAATLNLFHTTATSEPATPFLGKLHQSVQKNFPPCYYSLSGTTTMPVSPIKDHNRTRGSGQEPEADTVRALRDLKQSQHAPLQLQVLPHQLRSAQLRPGLKPEQA